MQLKMNEVKLPESVSFNYDELKNEISEKADFYANLVFTESQMAEAKSTRADLNKLKTALNDERLRQEKTYMEPFNKFKAQINEIISLIDAPVKSIDAQIKGFEEKQKEEKFEKIEEFWDGTGHPEWLSCNMIFDSKWLNKSFSMKKVQEAIIEKLDQIIGEIETLKKLPEFSFEAIEVYKQNLDINKAISEGQRLSDIQKRKLEAEAEKATRETPQVQEAEAVEQMQPEPEQYCQTNNKLDGEWLRFEAFLTTENAIKLREFFEANNINFRAI